MNINKIKTDTPVKVKNYNDREWRKRHFAFYDAETDIYWTFAEGRTSFSAIDDEDIEAWDNMEEV